MLLLFVVLVFHTALAYPHKDKVFYNEDHVQYHFEWFMKTFNRTYNNEVEKSIRFKIFEENLIKTNERNRRYAHGTYAINKFADLTNEEFLVRYTGLNPELSDGACPVVDGVSMTVGEAPAALDWRESIDIQVKNQDTCGSCWAFSATGNVEAQYAIKYKKYISLSEQQLVDCDSSSNGCKNGNALHALRYLIQSGGQETEDAYPYVNEQQTCQFSAGKAQVRVTDCIGFNFSDEDMIKEALAKYGPLTAAVDATSFQGYHSGIMECTFTSLGHAVMIIGYGTDADSGKDFWLIKNSWGTQWGENGFAKIERGINACGIFNDNIATSVIA